MAKHKSHDEGGGGSWLDTYADMVTLLLTFFVMLFSMSSVNEEKWEQLVRAFSRKGEDTSQVVIAPEGEGDDVGRNQSEFPPPGGEADLETQSNLPKNFNQLFEYLKSYVDENNMGASVSVEQSEGSVFIRFQDNLFFDPDKFNLKPASHDILNFLGDGLKSLQDQILTINISGHTAAVPSMEDYPISDWMLSSERASAVAIYLEEEKELNPAILLPIGYGKNHPVADNDTPEGRERNRRVDMLIVSKDSDADHQKLLQQILEGTYDPTQYPQNGGVSGVLLPDGMLEELPEEAPSENSAPGEADTPSASSAPEGQADGNNPGEEGASTPVEAGSEPPAAPESIN
ncbi:MAG: flagellar motor protein MotB [Provencibacterium sp.]|jgi:chemotaxis protein MotB|nr:flagellar motor protein MotB [Provencibacterium sp.]